MKCIFLNIIKRLYQNIFCNIHWKNLVELSKEVTTSVVYEQRMEPKKLLGKYLRIKGQVLKIRACNTAQVAVLQHEWRSHECCNTATSAVLHASIFNT